MDKPTCGSCRHYIGGGDWNLCCDLMYWLCYRESEACEKYEFSTEKIKELEQRDKDLAEYIQKAKEGNA